MIDDRDVSSGESFTIIIIAFGQSYDVSFNS